MAPGLFAITLSIKEGWGMTPEWVLHQGILKTPPGLTSPDWLVPAG